MTDGYVIVNLVKHSYTVEERNGEKIEYEYDPKSLTNCAQRDGWSALRSQKDRRRDSLPPLKANRCRAIGLRNNVRKIKLIYLQHQILPRNKD